MLGKQTFKNLDHAAEILSAVLRDSYETQGVVSMNSPLTIFSTLECGSALKNTQFQPLGRSSNGERIDLFVYMDSIGCLGNWGSPEKQRKNFIEYYGGKQLAECFREIHFRIVAGATCETFIGMITKDIVQFGKETELAEGKLDFEEASGNAQLVEQGKFKFKHQILLVSACNDAIGSDWTPWEVVPEPILKDAEKLSKILQKCSRVTIMGPGDDEIWQTPGFESQANTIMEI